MQGLSEKIRRGGIAGGTTMGLSLIIVQKIAVMFVLVLVGFLCAKAGMIDRETNKKLSALALRLVTPMLIFSSYQVEYEWRLVRNLLFSFAMAALAYAVQIPLAILFIRKKNNPNYQTERMALIFANCGFFGIPLIEGLYGTEAAMYLTAYVTLFNILLWSAGTAIMSGRFEGKQFLRSLASPAVIATVLGFGCLLLRLRLPSLLLEPVKLIAGMNTPFAMIVAGATLAETSLLPALKSQRTYLMIALKMLAIPAAAALLLSRMPLEELLVMIPIIATACPTGAACTMFAVLYDKNGPYASQLFALTTLTSIVTIPLIYLFGGVLVA